MGSAVGAGLAVGASDFRPDNVAVSCGDIPAVGSKRVSKGLFAGARVVFSMTVVFNDKTAYPIEIVHTSPMKIAAIHTQGDRQAFCAASGA